MKKMKMICVAVAAVVVAEKTMAQDPSFSQFFSSPLNVNPALTADINNKWRVISNYRNQWAGSGNPYQTGTVSFDSKIFMNNGDNYVDEITRIGIGGMMMSDKTMSGALKSNYASFNVSGNIRLFSNEGYDYSGKRVRHVSKIKMNEQSSEHRLGVGLGVIYGNRRLDQSKLIFEDQFTGNGFDMNLPTGEAAFSNMKPYFSTSAGIIYSNITSKNNFELGVAAFHINKPKQSFLEDENQFLPRRFVVHSNFETLLGESYILSTNGIYQYQSGASYFSAGGALGYSFSTDRTDIIVNAGLWYWTKNAIVSYAGLSYGNLQIGLSYDITISKLAGAAMRPHTFELCMIFRGDRKDNGVIPAPWK